MWFIYPVLHGARLALCCGWTHSSPYLKQAQARNLPDHLALSPAYAVQTHKSDTLLQTLPRAPQTAAQQSTFHPSTFTTLSNDHYEGGTTPLTASCDSAVPHCKQISQ